MTGSIPACIFDLPLLGTLLADSNGWTGTIPDNIRLNLTNLSLGYNHLSGTIPNSIQNKTNFLYLGMLLLQLVFNQQKLAKRS